VVDSLFIPSGYMGDGATAGSILQEINMSCLATRPVPAAGNCHKFTYTPVAIASGGLSWGGVYWQYPVNNWGASPGKKIAQVAAADLKRVTLELGGNDPAIILDDVDPEKIVGDVFNSAFANSGQVCTAIKRLYVHEKVYAPILDGLIERAKAAKVGDGLAEGTEYGPINNKMQFDRVVGLVEDARQHGGRIVAGGKPLDRPGYFLPPTIVTEVGPGIRLVDEEQFGTALPVIKYRNLDDAIEEANKTHYGLGGSIWTSNLARGEELAQRLESGTGWVNHHMDILPNTPFGGCKWSGLGYENGRWGYEEFTELQVVNAKK
jgi:acyl-CoA reductase-like NAD-dependent aldehyde dehydrogenase